jgi:hypothetical protein
MPGRVNRDQLTAAELRRILLAGRKGGDQQSSREQPDRAAPPPTAQHPAAVRPGEPDGGAHRTHAAGGAVVIYRYKAACGAFFVSRAGVERHVERCCHRYQQVGLIPGGGGDDD